MGNQIKRQLQATMKKFSDKSLQNQYDSDSDFRAQVDRTQVEYDHYVQKAKYMQKDQIMDESIVERFISTEKPTIYFFYGFQQPIPTKDRTKLTLNFFNQFHPEPKERFVFVYFNQKTPNSDYFLQFKNIFMLLPLKIIDKMDQFILVKPSFYIKAINFIRLGGVIQKYFGKHYSTVQNGTELCKLLNINPRQFASFVPQILSEQFPAQFKKKPSLATYRINLTGQNMTESQLNDRLQFQQTITSLIKKQVFKLQNYQIGELGIPVILQLLISYFQNKPDELNKQGIFRRCVSIDEETQTLTELCKRNYQYLQKIQNPFLIAVLIKKFFHNLKQPIIPFESFPLLIHDQGVKDKRQLIKDVAATFPELNRLTLIFLIDFLRKDVISRQHSNKMSLNNVAICFAPCLMRSQQNTANAAVNILYATKAVTIINTMLTDVDFIFGTEQERLDLFKMNVINHSRRFQETIKLQLSMDLDQQDQTLFSDTNLVPLQKVQDNQIVANGLSKNQQKAIRKKSLSEVSNQIKQLQNRFFQRKKNSQAEIRQDSSLKYKSQIFLQQTTSFVLQKEQHDEIQYTEKVFKKKHEQSDITQYTPSNKPQIQNNMNHLPLTKSNLKYLIPRIN